VTCPICMEDVAEVFARTIGDCGHGFCLECLGGHVRARVGQRHLSSDLFVCPAVDCTTPLTVQDVRAVTIELGPEHADVWNQYSDAADDTVIERLVVEGTARRCPAPTCGYVFTWDTSCARNFQCPKCSATFCLQCTAAEGAVGPAHPGESCEGYVDRLAADGEAAARLVQWRRENAAADDRFRALLREEFAAGGSKPCPHCGMAITKNGGCAHHDCLTCRTKFCWNCGGFYSGPRRTRANTCGYTCTKAERVWWTAEAAAAPPPPVPRAVPLAVAVAVAGAPGVGAAPAQPAQGAECAVS